MMPIWVPLLISLLQVEFRSTAPGGPNVGPAVRITSPLGRSATSGSIRIVAQVQPQAGVDLGPVRFFIDGQLLQTDTDGAPYVAEWTDENPFERREITVAVADALGREVTDRVVLEPFEVTEEAQVTSVLIEASVRDRTGRFVKSIPPSSFSIAEDDVPQTLDLGRYEAVGATFALLIDSSASMSRRLDFVQRTAATLATYMSPLDRTIVAPFSKGLLPRTGPTDDRTTVTEAIRGIRTSGGTAILDSLLELSKTFPEGPGRRAVVLITDGYDENSSATVDEAIDALKSARATVYAVAIGGVAGISLKGEKVLRRITSETGGRIFLPVNDDQLQFVHSALADDVQNRYLLTYTPSNQKHDGKWRQIRVDLSEKSYQVSARPGYFAPKPAPIRPSIEFTATEPTGAYLTLSAEDVDVLEDGVPQRIETFHEASQSVSIVLALDASGSMRHREAEVIAAAHSFAAALRPQDKLGLLLFSDTTALIHDLSTDREATRGAIDTYKTAGGTALYDAVADALKHLEHAEGRRVVVAMTDGRDENNPGTAPGSRRTLPEVLRTVKESGVTVYSIGLGDRVDSGPLQQFADLSGGRMLQPRHVSELFGEFQRVIEDLQRHYVVGYTSTHPAHDGRWRTVEIRMKSAPNVSVRSAGGYTAPERAQ